MQIAKCENVYYSNNHLLQILAIYSVLYAIPAFREFFPITIIGRIQTGVSVCTIVIFLSKYKKKLDTLAFIYVISLAIIALFHIGLHSVDNPIKNSLIWINIILIIYIYKDTNLNTNWIACFVFMFYVIECGLCIIERLEHFYFINYSNAELLSATHFDAASYDSINFRSRGLLLHPLYNANVISIYMGYILTSKGFSNVKKVFLLIIGALAIWACNSRGCLIIWGFIFIYRFFLYKISIFRVVICVIIAYLLLPIIIDFVKDNEILGRLNLNLFDASTESRIIAYTVFGAYPWTLEKIIIGIGDWIYYPKTNVSLENGFLLNLAYWGWIVGCLKSLIEIIVTWRCLHSYGIKEKIIIMLSFWGVASMNNNVINILFLSFFAVVNIAIQQNFDNSEHHKKTMLFKR